MENNSATKRSQTARTCLCGGNVFRERYQRRGHWLTRFVCGDCECATLWLVAGRNGEETQELVYLWGIAQTKKAEAMESAESDTDRQQRLARESVDRTIAALERANAQAGE